MTIRYPLSFWATVGISVLTAALAFVLTFAHLLALTIDLGALWGLRALCHAEVRDHPWLNKLTKLFHKGDHDAKDPS